MKTIEFTEEGGTYVSPALVPDDDGVVSLQLGFKAGAILVVEMRIDDSLPWSRKAVIGMPSLPETFCEKIVGIASTDIVRLRVNKMPVIAAIV